MMTIARRRVMQLAASAMTLPVTARIARAETYPARPVRIVVGGAPGSSPDVMARLMSDWLSRRLGQPFVVENKGGGGSEILAAEAVVRAPPDGYTLLLVTSSAAINVGLYDALNYDFQRDVAPVAGMIGLPMVVLVTPSMPMKTLPEFIAYAKANPGRVNIGTPPVTSPQYVAGALFEMMTGTKLALIPYRGGPAAITDALGGQVQGVIGTVALTIEYIKAGTLRPLAVTTLTRSDALPDIPTVADVVPGFDATQWIGIGAPRGMPADVVDKLNAAVNAGLADPAMKAKIAAFGGMTMPGTPADFGKFIAAETQKWVKVVKFSGAKAE
jgi:tripartite-type tricarboxylate transporter receptor subunit TctC